MSANSIFILKCLSLLQSYAEELCICLLFFFTSDEAKQRGSGAERVRIKSEKRHMCVCMFSDFVSALTKLIS